MDSSLSEPEHFGLYGYQIHFTDDLEHGVIQQVTIMGERRLLMTRSTFEHVKAKMAEHGVDTTLDMTEPR